MGVDGPIILRRDERGDDDDPVERRQVDGGLWTSMGGSAKSWANRANGQPCPSPGPRGVVEVVGVVGVVRCSESRVSTLGRRRAATKPSPRR
jgi:hypothetical protein